MNIEMAYELADKLANKGQGFVAVRIERYNFNDGYAPQLIYVLSMSHCPLLTFDTLADLIYRLEELLK